MITAAQAKLNFCREDYVEAIKQVTEAIIAASYGNHEVSVTIPTGTDEVNPNSWKVAESLRENGFNVSLHHGDSGSSTLYIGW